MMRPANGVNQDTLDDYIYDIKNLLWDVHRQGLAISTGISDCVSYFESALELEAEVDPFPSNDFPECLTDLLELNAPINRILFLLKSLYEANKISVMNFVECIKTLEASLAVCHDDTRESFLTLKQAIYLKYFPEQDLEPNAGSKEANELISKICHSFERKKDDVLEQVENFKKAIKLAPNNTTQFLQKIRDAVVNHPNFRPYFFILELARLGLITTSELYRVDLKTAPPETKAIPNSATISLLTALNNFYLQNYVKAAEECLENLTKYEDKHKARVATILASGKINSYKAKITQIPFETIKSIAAHADRNVQTNLWFQMLCPSSLVGALQVYRSNIFGQRTFLTFEEKVEALKKTLPELKYELSRETKRLLIRDGVVAKLISSGENHLTKYLLAQIEEEVLLSKVENCLRAINRNPKTPLNISISEIHKLLTENPKEFKLRFDLLIRHGSRAAQNCLLYYGITRLTNGECNAAEFINTYLLPFNDSLISLQSNGETKSSAYATRLCLLGMGYNLIGNKLSTLEKCIIIKDNNLEIPEELAQEINLLLAETAKVPVIIDDEVATMRVMLERFMYSGLHGRELDAFESENLASYETESAKKQPDFLKKICMAAPSKVHAYFFGIRLRRLGRITEGQFKEAVFTDFQDQYSDLLDDQVTDVEALYAIACYWSGDAQQTRLQFNKVFTDLILNKKKLRPEVEAEFYHIILNEKLPKIGKPEDQEKLLAACLTTEFHDANLKLNLLLQSCNIETYVGYRLQKPINPHSLLSTSHVKLIANTLLLELQRKHIVIHRSSFLSVLQGQAFVDLDADSQLSDQLHHVLTSWVVPDDYEQEILKTCDNVRPTVNTIVNFMKLTRNNQSIILNCLAYTIKNNLELGFNLLNKLFADKHINREVFVETVNSLLYLYNRAATRNLSDFTKIGCYLVLAYHQLGCEEHIISVLMRMMNISGMTIVHETEFFNILLKLPPVNFREIDPGVVLSNFLHREFKDKDLQKTLLVHGLIPGTFMYSLFNAEKSLSLDEIQQVAAKSICYELNNNWNMIRGQVADETLALLSTSGVLEKLTNYPKLVAQLKEAIRKSDMIPGGNLEEDYGHNDL